MVEVVDGYDPKVCEMEENIWNPVENVEKFQAAVEPESIISQATIGVFHQDESKILKYLEQFALISIS